MLDGKNRFVGGEIARWQDHTHDPMKRRIDAQQERMLQAEERLLKCLERGERARRVIHEVVLGNLLALIEKSFTPSPRLIFELGVCDVAILASLFGPAHEAKDERSFLQVLQLLKRPTRSISRASGDASSRQDKQRSV